MRLSLMWVWDKVSKENVEQGKKWPLCAQRAWSASEAWGQTCSKRL